MVWKDYIMVQQGVNETLGIPAMSGQLKKGSLVLAESVGILMEQARGQRFRHLMLAHNADDGSKPMWVSMDSQKNKR